MRSLTYSDEQEEFRSVVRRFLDDHSPPTEVRRWMEDDAGFDPAVWRRLCDDLGVGGLHLPEAYGGQAFSAVEQSIVLQEMGRALLCSPYFGSIVLAATAIAHGATDAAKKERLPDLANGSQRAALAFAEQTSAWSPHDVAMTATADGADFRLDGSKRFVVDGHSADGLVVVARVPGSTGTDGLSLFWVAGDADGLERRRLESLDPSRKLAQLDFAGVRAAALGAPGTAAGALDHTLDLACIALAHEMVGGAERVLETTVEYAKTRVQFGRPIGSFQAIKHKCADMLVDVELAKSTAIHAAAAAAEGAEDLPLLAALTKALVSDAYRTAATESIQIHGGIGFTWEHDCHLYFKRARSAAILLGDATHHRERMARLLELGASKASA
ncbi:MAG: acyl-CoA dehydrogenase family protein [Myxococcota bacterium]